VVVGLIALLSASVACSLREPRPDSTSRNPLVGEWETAPTLSQLGTITTFYAFKSDGTFTLTVTYIDAKLPATTRVGRYSTSDDTVHLFWPEAESTAEYKFDDGMLVLSEGTDVFRLQRK